MNSVTLSCGINKAPIPHRETIKKILLWTCAKQPSFVSNSPSLLSEISDTASYCHYIISVLAVEISNCSKHPRTAVMMSCYQTWELKYSGMWHLSMEQFATVWRTVVLSSSGPSNISNDHSVFVIRVAQSSWIVWPWMWSDRNLSKCLELLNQQ